MLSEMCPVLSFSVNWPVPYILLQKPISLSKYFAYFITYTRVPVKFLCRFKIWKLLSRNVLKFAYKIELITHLGRSSLRSFRMIPFLPQLEQLITSKPKSNCFRFETLNEIISGGIWKNCENVKMVARKEGIRR